MAPEGCTVKWRKFLYDNLPAFVIAAVLIGWFFFVGEFLSRYCPLDEAGSGLDMSCDIFIWWRWFD